MLFSCFDGFAIIQKFGEKVGRCLGVSKLIHARLAKFLFCLQILFLNFDVECYLMFALDPTTLYRARTEYQSEFKRHWKEDKTGERLWIQIMSSFVL